MIKAHFELPDDFKPLKERYYEAVEAVDRCILDLFFKARIKTEELETSEMREELKNAINNDFQSNTVNDIENSWWTNKLPTIDELVQSGMLYNSEELTPKQLMEGYDNLKNNFHEMQFHKWRDVPLSLSLDEYSIDLNGFLIIPYNFEVNEFRKFLNQNYDKLRQRRTKSIGESAEILVDLLDELNVHVFSIGYDKTIPLDQLIYCLYKLEKEKENLTNLNIYISKEIDKYDLNDTGLLTIPINFELEKLNEFENNFEPGKFDIIREFHRVHKLLKDEVEGKGQEIVEILRCKELDVTSHNQFHPYDILQFLNYLKENQLHLTRFDWSEYRFILSTSKEIKIKDDNVFLPIIFSIEFLIKTIEQKNKKNSGKETAYDMIEKRKEKDKTEMDKEFEKYNKDIGKIWKEFKFDPNEYELYLEYKEMEEKHPEFFKDDIKEDTKQMDEIDEIDENQKSNDLKYFNEFEKKLLKDEKVVNYLNEWAKEREKEKKMK